MRIVICGSLSFVHEMDDVRRQLEALKHEAIVPLGVDLVETRRVTLDQLNALKDAGMHHTLAIEHDAIRKHYEKILNGDAILVTNWEKKSIPGYIGGNTFLEMGFAHVLHKPIFVLYPLPELSYTDEMLAMQPVILNGELSLITP